MDETIQIGKPAAVGKGRNVWVALGVLLVVAYVVFWEGCFASFFCTSDGCQYLRCAEKIRALGTLNGLEGFDGDAWFCVWPIGYPAAIACVSGLTGLDAFMSTRILALLSAALLLVAFWCLARPAFPVLALGLLNLAFLKTFRSPLSEVLFIPLLAVLGLYLHRGRCHVAWLVALFVGLFLARYVGVFAPIWAMAGVAFVRGRPSSDRASGNRLIRQVGVAAVIAWAVEGAYLLCNLTMTGRLTGMPRDTLRAPWPVLLRDIATAEAHELQAFGIVAAVVLVLCALARKRPSRGAGQTQGGSLVVMGMAYHCTIVAIRCAGGCSELGFRFLYPGTILIIMGLLLAYADWSDVIRRIRPVAFTCLMVFVCLTGCGLLKAELALRRIAGVRTYGVGESYPALRDKMKSKYANVKPGEVIQVKHLSDPDLPVMFLRPDCKVALPEGVRRY